MNIEDILSEALAGAESSKSEMNTSILLAGFEKTLQLKMAHLIRLNSKYKLSTEKVSNEHYKNTGSNNLFYRNLRPDIFIYDGEDDRKIIELKVNYAKQGFEIYKRVASDIEKYRNVERIKIPKNVSVTIIACITEIKDKEDGCVFGENLYTGSMELDEHADSSEMFTDKVNSYLDGNINKSQVYKVKSELPKGIKAYRIELN